MQPDPVLTRPALPPRDIALRQQAQALETAFLAEMLRHAGAARTPEGFGGGIGEDQFASFLREAQAAAISARGGIGLAEHLFRALQGLPDAGA